MSLAQVATALEAGVAGRVALDQPLASLTTYRLGGPAALFFEPASVQDLIALTSAIRAAGLDPERVPLLVMGRGSNVVISDRGFDGIVVRMAAGMSWIEPASDDQRTVRAGAATSLPVLANWAARRSLGGLEFTVGVPGSVGGGVRMNAGAHGGEVADTLAEVEVFDLRGGEVGTVVAADLQLGYRSSALGPTEVVVEATFRLIPGDAAEIKARMESYRRHRAETQPGALQNAGSTFKNPPGDSAGRLVDAAGLKGFGVGGAHVSELHANFFIASSTSTAQDVFDLVQEVRHRVLEATGVELEPEVRFVGPFADALSETEIVR